MKFAFVGFFSALLLTPMRAEAQWYFGVSLGANHTQQATVSIDQPSRNTSLQYHGVAFTAEPFKSPPYYGWRLGKLIGHEKRLGLELEFVHLKVFSRTHERLSVTGRFEGTELGGASYMDGIVGRYAMSHGLNFVVVNVVTRLPLRDRVSAMFRVGAGPTLPHAETTIVRESLEQYEYGGMGLHGSGGLQYRVRPRIAAFAEYKLTYARPVITIAHGTGRMTALTHHLAAGVIFAITQ